MYTRIIYCCCCCRCLCSSCSSGSFFCSFGLHSFCFPLSAVIIGVFSGHINQLLCAGKRAAWCVCHQTTYFVKLVARLFFLFHPTATACSPLVSLNRFHKVI